MSLHVSRGETELERPNLNHHGDLQKKKTPVEHAMLTDTNNVSTSSLETAECHVSSVGRIIPHDRNYLLKSADSNIGSTPLLNCHQIELCLTRAVIHNGYYNTELTVLYQFICVKDGTAVELRDRRGKLQSESFPVAETHFHYERL